ncbi:MAG TPA: hypothetical protein DDY78_16680 [Planctomycetales bacterium]|jgi:hypothetical protein|nr:hypothetical protein [Planctomycetales bacterium]
MATFFRFGAFELYRSRDEIEALIQHKARGLLPGETIETVEIETVEIDAELIWNAQTWSVWTDGKVRKVSLCVTGWFNWTLRPGNGFDLVPLGTAPVPPPPWSDYSEPRFTAVRDKGHDTLDRDAAKFIAASLGSDSDRPAWLGRVRGARKARVVHSGDSHGSYARKRIVQYELTLSDGTTPTVYVLTQGYFEGYVFEIYDTLAAARREWSPVDPNGPLECWECGAVYDEPGHVEAGCMGCVRCNS